MRALVVGAGAVGQYISARLRLAGHDVVLLARQAQAPELDARGIALQADGARREVRVRATADAASPLLNAAFELVVVAVKSTATRQAIEAIGAVAAAGDASILTPQNGLGNEELLAAAFGSERVVAAALTTAIERLDARTLKASVHGGLVVSPLGALAHNWLIAAFADSGMRIRAAADWRSLKWSKLCINLMANAVCAALDWTPAQVYADPCAFSIDRRCLEETRAVMQRLNVRPISLIDFPVPSLLWLTATLSPGILRPLLSARVRGARGGKLPSLLQDLRAGCRELEIGALNGAVAQRAKKAGLDAAANAQLSRIVAGIARGDVDWSLYRGRPQALKAAIERG